MARPAVTKRTLLPFSPKNSAEPATSTMYERQTFPACAPGPPPREPRVYCYSITYLRTYVLLAALEECAVRPPRKKLGPFESSTAATYAQVRTAHLGYCGAPAAQQDACMMPTAHAICPFPQCLEFNLLRCRHIRKPSHAKRYIPVWLIKFARRSSA